MKKYEITKEQILELSTNSSITWKMSLYEWFPDAFKKEFEVGKWYKKESFKAIFLFNGSKDADGDPLGCGFVNGFWINNGAISSGWSGDFVLASKEEVETALINELWRRFKIEDRIKCVNGTETTIKGRRIAFNVKKNVITLDDSENLYELFNNGEWATIAEPPTELTVAEIEKKLGYSIKIVK
jgi:hypothetical protein